MRYRSDMFADNFASQSVFWNPPAFVTGSTQVHQVSAEKRRQDKFSKERRHCELLVHWVPRGRDCV